MKQKYLLFFSSIALIFSALAQAQTAIYTGLSSQGDQTLLDLDFYGDHIAFDSKWTIVGAPRESIDFNNDGNFDTALGEFQVGAIYIYENTPAGPVLHTKIAGEGNDVDPGSPGDRFGAGIVIQGDVMFVGGANAIDGFNFAGQVYVFNYDAATDEWVLVQKLASDEPNDSGSFGARTDSSHMELFSFGNGQPDATVALIGEVENGTGVPATLHVFKRKKNSDQWDRVQKVGPPSGVTNALFADKIEGIGKLALVTESGIDELSDPAVVHVYRINANGIVKFKGKPQPVQTLDRPSGPTDQNDCFADYGQGMSAANGIVVIGDPCDDTAANNSGAVNVYTVDDNGNNDPLTLVQTLLNPTGLADAFFGVNFGNGKQTVTTDGDLIVVGTTFAGPVVQDVWMFARDANGDFVPVQTIPSPAPGIPGLEGYGQSVNLLGDGVLTITQLSDGTAFTGNGIVFVFVIL